MRPVLALCFLLLLPVAAHARVDALPTQQHTLTADRAVDRVCHSRLLPAGTPGTDRLTYTAPAIGAASFRLDGGRGDWDIAVFDAAGRKRSASANGASVELASAWLRAGERVTLQACRRSGAESVRLGVERFAGSLPAAEMAPKLVTVDYTDLSQVKLLEEAGLDVTETRTATTVDIVLYGRKELELLERTGLPFSTKIADLEAQFAQDRRQDAAADGPSSLPTGRTAYREYEEFGTELKQLAEANPDLVKRIELPGKSFQGRTVEGVEIAENVRRPQDGRPVFLVVGVHHAREWPSAEIAMEWAHYLVEGYKRDERITNILRSSRLVIVPIINPDGFVSTKNATFDPAEDPEYTAAAATGTGGYRRKNCNGPGATPERPCEANTGVDPNRNYGAGWGGVGASADPTSQTYRGSGPFSEPETQNLQKFGQSRNVVTMITIHNVAALVLRPPGRSTDGLAPDEQRLKALGDAIQDSTGYVSQYGWQLYDTSGTTEDWFYAATGSFGYTIELGPHKGFFHMPYDIGVVNEWEGRGARDTENGFREKPGQGMREALLKAAEQAIATTDHSVLEGSAPPGAKLTLSKKFQTSTSPVCAFTVSFPARFVDPPLSEVTKDRCDVSTDPILFDDEHTVSMTVPENGAFEWHVNPSTRPFEKAAGKTEAYTLTCEAGSTVQSRELVIDRGQTAGDLGLCGATGPRCTDSRRPSARVRSARVSKRRVLIRGSAGDRSCGTSGVVRKVRVAVFRKQGAKCRFITEKGRLTKARSCKKPKYMKVKGTAKWRVKRKVRVSAGRYRLLVRVVDGAGNKRSIRRRAKR